MGNLSNKVNLLVTTIDKGNVNELSLVNIFDFDIDFSDEDGKSEKTSKEIFDKIKQDDGIDLDEYELVNSLVGACFDIPNFIGTSDYYGGYEYEITETEFQYIISIAFLT